MRIERLTGREILDSRGRPTVEACCVLADGAVGIASAPSGMSTGAAEARDLRDGEPGRYQGLGCRRAAANISGEINDRLRGRGYVDQAELDGSLIELDGTERKERLGGNATTAVSVAYARAGAADRDVPLYRHFADLAGRPLRTIPRPTINLFSGGKHAGGQVPIQDVLVVPIAASVDDCLSTMYAIYRAAADRAETRYRMRPLTADEGGLAPPFRHAEDMLDEAVAAIEAAGYSPGHDAALAVDVAASHFHDADGYHLGAEPIDAPAMVDVIRRWVSRYPLVSVEDGLAEDDWDHWPELRAAVGGDALVLGDDLLCTSASRVRRAVESGAADALLLKVNQAGTLTEALAADATARSAGWSVTASARSGETEDDWLADLAVGWGADQIKVGSITQSERLAKYNRLLRIQAETGLEIVRWPAAEKDRRPAR